jgi:hypothetical protein
MFRKRKDEDRRPPIVTATIAVRSMQRESGGVRGLFSFDAIARQLWD